ncbi:MAG TPA: FAD-binding oxidoreductase [Gammaproteobacteria bacterium]|nr:FAD-binding oxidoreductase [Gammaproteobacteria bacterium]
MTKRNKKIAVSESSVILQTLQETLTAKNLLFPLDLGARGSCTIGDNVATNAGGINALRYGMMRHLVLSLASYVLNVFFCV